MITLFIDTSSSDVSIAIVKDEKVISKIVKNIPNEHSVYAVKFVNDVLETIGMKPNDIDNILNIIDGDLNVYNKLITIKEDCYFIEFKLVPNCNIHGAYIDQHDVKDVNNFVIKLDKPKVSNIITNDSTIVTSTNTPSDIIVKL